MIRPDEQVLIKELAQAVKKRGKYPRGWANHLAVGRCLHWLGDPSAVTSFKKAIELCPKPTRHQDATGIGMLHQLAGDHAQARRYFKQTLRKMSSELKRGQGNRKRVIKVAFLAGEDRQVERLAQELRQSGWDPGPLTDALITLSKARRRKDALEASQGTNAIAEMILTYKPMISENYCPQLWDWYEMGLEIWRVHAPDEAENVFSSAPGHEAFKVEIRPELNLPEPIQKALRKELPGALKRLARDPDSWRHHVSVGRCFRWLSDPIAVNHIRQGIRMLPRNRMADPKNLLNLGNLYRLVGDHEQAEYYFQQAWVETQHKWRDLQQRATKTRLEDWPSFLQDRIFTSFLIRDYEETIALADRFRKVEVDQDLLVFDIGRLALAFKFADGELLSREIEAFSKRLQRYQTAVAESRGPHGWDYYDMALEFLKSLDTGEKPTHQIRETVHKPALDIRYNLLNIIDLDQATPLSWSYNSGLLAGIKGGKIVIWRVEDGQLLDFGKGNSGQITSLVFNPAYAVLASADKDGLIILWDVESGKMVHRLNASSKGLTHLSFDPLGNALASSTVGWDQNELRLWNVQDGQPVWTIKGWHNQPIYWCPDGEKIATGVKAIHIWRARDGQPVDVIRGLPEEFDLTDLSWSPDGSLLASGANDMKVRIWKVSSGDALHELQGHVDAGVRDLYLTIRVAFDPDGKVLASAGPDGNVFLWDVSDGKLLHEFIGHTEPIGHIQWHPAGHLLASGGIGGKILIWSTADGLLAEELEVDEIDVRHFAWSPDGVHLAGCGYQGSVKIWKRV